ncbi:MAG: hypothetical protein ABIY70_25385 [Capsulimonas sp.]|uniref:hypothetical protein n=1 Tax=Capsulimonas sp. TaxID=2494211 RepID=UPI003266B40B
MKYEKKLNRTTCLLIISAISQMFVPGKSLAETPEYIAPALTTPFTLTYTLSGKSTSEGRDSQYRAVKRQIDSMVANGSMSQKDRDAILTQAGSKSSPTVHHVASLTISYNGHRTLFSYHSHDSNEVLIYDGERSFYYAQDLDRATITPGLSSYQFPAFFFPGVNLPQYSILRNLSSVNPSQPNGELMGKLLLVGPRGEDQRNPGLFLPATVDATQEKGKFKILSSLIADNGNSLQSWKFSGHTPFQGEYIPTNITFTRYVSGTKNTISSIMNYRLQTKTDQPEPDSAFILESAIPDKLTVQDDVGTPSVAVNYDSHKSNIDKQIDVERNMQQLGAIQVSNGNPKSRANSGVLALIGLMFLGVAWFVWRRGKQN